MKIAFINPPFKPRYSRGSRSPAVTKSGTVYYPIWLALSAGLAEKNGHTITLIDAPIIGLDFETSLVLLKDFAPDLLVVETSTGSITNDGNFCCFIKENLPNTFICMVGNHVTACYEETLKQFKLVDAIARKEYEETILDLANTLAKNQDLKNVASLVWRDKNNFLIVNQLRAPLKDLDSLPFASSIFKRFCNPKDYFFAAARFPQVMIYTGRGCPYLCTFCVYPQNLYDHKYRYRSAKNIADEFSYIAQNFPKVVEVTIEDDTFTIYKERVIEFCKILIDRKNKLTWTCNVRADLDLETLKWMKKAKCRLVIVGFESGSNEILALMKKGLTVEKFTVAKNAKKAGILVHACYMFGNRGETLTTMQETLKVAIKMNTDTAQFFPLMIYPGTEAYQWAKTEGLINANSWSDWLTEDGLHNTVIKTKDLSSSEIVAFCNYARKKYYLRPAYFWLKFKNILKNPHELIRTIKSFKTFAKHLFKKQDKSITDKFKASSF